MTNLTVRLSRFSFTRATVLALAITLAGCQTGAQQHLTELGRVATAANSQRSTCLASFRDNPAYLPIVRRFAKPPSPYARPALTRLGDPDKVTDAEAVLLVARFDETSRCEEAWAKSIEPGAPAMAALRRQYVAENGQRQLRLVRREITWGEANQQADALALRTAARTQEVAAAMGQQLDQQHNAEVARRDAALSAFGNALQQQQQINARSRPVTTNCQRFGSGVNCTTN